MYQSALILVFLTPMAERYTFKTEMVTLMSIHMDICAIDSNIV